MAYCNFSLKVGSFSKFSSRAIVSSSCRSSSWSIMCFIITNTACPIYLLYKMYNRFVNIKTFIVHSLVYCVYLANQFYYLKSNIVSISCYLFTILPILIYLFHGCFKIIKAFYQSFNVFIQWHIGKDIKLSHHDT